MKKSKFKADKENLGTMINFIIDGLNEKNFDKKKVRKIRLVAEEILTNIVLHAYPGKTGDVEISYTIDKNDALTITISDWGISFNPLAESDPDIDVPVNDREIGGLGIFLTKKIMDHVHYKREDNKNILTMIKKK